MKKAAREQVRATLLLALLLLPPWGARATAAELAVEIRDANGALVADAVAYAQPADGSVTAPRSGTRALIDQVNKEFVPRVSVVQAGTQVFFPNSDNIRHSIYSFSPAKTFTTKLYSGREAAPILFDKTGLVVLGCNIHDTMVAWVFIVDTPWFGKSGADGVAMLKDLPAGEYIVTAAAPSANLKSRQLKLHVDGGGSGPVRLPIVLAAGP